MKTPKNSLILLLALTTIGGAIVAWQQYSELVELRAAAMNKDERADLQKRVWELEKLNKQLRDQLAANRPPGGDPESMIAANGDGPPDGRGGPEGRGGRRGNPMQQFNALRDLMAKPEVQALLSVQQKAAVEARYAALFKNLNLAPDQAEKLKTILAERQTTMQDVMSAAREQGIDPRNDQDAVQKLMEVARNDINNSIKSVIGESGFTQFEDYEKTLPQRNVVNQLQQRLSYGDTPLTSTQAEQLVQILATNTPAPTPGTPGAPQSGQPGDRGPAFNFGGGPGGGRGPDMGAIGAVIGSVMGGGGGPGGGGLLALGGPGGGNAIAPITSSAVSQAQTVLAGPQLTALQQLQQQQQSQQQLAKIVGETLAAQNAANAQRGGTPPAQPPVKKSGG